MCELEDRSGRTAGAPVTLADFEGKPTFMSIDLASVQDLAALFLAARDGAGWIVWCRQYCPEAQVQKRANAGQRIDQDVILSDIATICSEADVRKIAIDRGGARSAS